MSQCNLRTFDRDENLLIKLCLKLNFLTYEQIEEAAKKHSGKQLIFALCDSGCLNGEQISELMRLREFSLICPHCNTLNIQESLGNRVVCKKCQQRLPEHSENVSSVCPGQELGKYKILEKVADGSVGIVYKAMHTGLNRLVALKILKSEQINDVMLTRFQIEASTIASLKHFNIVEVYDIGEEHGIHYIAMEYLVGKTLGYFIEKKLLTMRQSVKITADIAAGLYHAHQRGIIHRDIKPENIIINENGDAKITDFGLAKQIKQDVRLTHQNVIMGTPLYMSPEQALGNEQLGPATDIYSLGVVLYEMLVGRPPFYHISTITLLQKIVSEKPPSLRELNPNIPLPLQKICLQALDKNSQNRFASMYEMQKELEAVYSKSTTNTAQSNSAIGLGANTKSGEPIRALPASNSGILNSASQNINIHSEEIHQNTPTTSSAPNQRTSRVKEYMQQEKARQDERFTFEDCLLDPTFLIASVLVLILLGYLMYSLFF